ncbi:MAG: shikimate dehydrogenase [Armatimonadia bacterium]|nr:shikimate dehydrogenase [Armatimonadia bacterium]
MSKFAFILHPISARDVGRKYMLARILPDPIVEGIMGLMPAQVISRITGVESPTGAQTEGWFVGCTLTTRQFIQRKEKRTVPKVIEAAELAQNLGAQIIGLGAFTAVVGDGGQQVADAIDVGVTTGNSYTVATAVQGALRGAEVMGIDPSQATCAVMGATGSIGRVCAHLLAEDVERLVLIGRRKDGLEQVAGEVSGIGAGVEISLSPGESLSQAHMVVTVTSALDAVIEPDMLRPGAVVCDVARPRDVSVAVSQQRDDVLVIEGGSVAVPGKDLNFRFNFGFPPGTAYACMAETMLLALEGHTEDYSLGKRLTVERVREISELADRHGFTLAGFRSFERAVDDETIQRIRERAVQCGASLGEARPIDGRV